MIRRLALAALAALALAAPAAGAQVQQSPQALSDATAAFLSDALHRPVEPRALEVTTVMLAEQAYALPAGSVVAEYRHADTIYVRPWIASALVNPGDYRRRMAGATLRHELLHRPLCNADGTGFDSGVARAVEEGLVESVTFDTSGAWAQLFAPNHQRRHGVAEFGAYLEEVAMVRAASKVATGSSTWRSRAARAWRVQLLFTPCDQRAAAWPSTPTTEAPR